MGISQKEELSKDIGSKSVNIGIIGLGYVGLPIALSFFEAGFKVVGFDTDKEKINKLNNGKSYISHISERRINNAINSNHFYATAQYSNADSVDALVLCLPTPLNKFREPDMSYVFGTVNDLFPYLRKGQLICLESTTYPGTTDEIAEIVSSKGFEVGKDIFVVYSPEREDPGNDSFTTSNTPKIIGGVTSDCLDLGVALYNKIVNKVITVSSTKTAELTKLLENIYRSVNIGLVNELKIVADRMGIDIREVIDAAATKPFGFQPFYPGPGWGGHCIPIDPFYLTWKAREYGIQTRFIELAGEVNTAMPEWITGKIMDALNDYGKPLKGADVLVLGIAYKKNVNDTRESPAVKLMEILRSKGAKLSYCDPYVPVFPKMRQHYFDLESVESTQSELQEKDCIIITTDHDDFDYEFIYENSRLIIDTRGCYRGNYPKVVSC